MRNEGLRHAAQRLSRPRRRFGRTRHMERLSSVRAECVTPQAAARRSFRARICFGYSWHRIPVPLDDVEVANHSRRTAANLNVGPSQGVVDLVNVIAEVDGACLAVETDCVDVLDRDAVR